MEQQRRGGARELVKVANTLQELEVLLEDVDLTGIAVVDAEATLLVATRAETAQAAVALLTRGLSGMLNQSSVGTGMQVLRALGVAGDHVARIRVEAVAQVRIKLTETLASFLTVHTTASGATPATPARDQGG